MAQLQLGDWGTYCRFSGTSTFESYDFACRWKIYYEQNTQTGVTTITTQPYIQIKADDEITIGSIYVYTKINGVAKYQYITPGTVVCNGSYAYKWGVKQTFTITHAADGTASCPFSGYMSGDYGGSFKKTASHTYALPTINMASSITNNTNASSRINFGSPVTFTITRPNDTITHTLKYTWAGKEYTITNVGTSVQHTFSDTFCNDIPTSTETSITVTCVSSNGTTCSTVVYLSVPSYSPTAALSISVNNSGNPWGSTYVAGYSKINYTLTGKTSYNAVISSYSVTVLGVPLSYPTGTSSVINGSGTVSGYVRDSRGKQSSTVSASYTAHSYSVPTISGFTAQRCNSAGTLTNDGTYIKTSFSYNIASVNSVNAKKYKIIAYDASGSPTTIVNETTLGSYSGSISKVSSVGTFDTAKRYTIRVFLIDSIQTSGVTFDTTIAAKFVPLSAYKGGQGITLGAAATGTGFNVYMNTLLANDVTIGTSSQSSPPSASLRIHDLRNYNVTPSSFKPYGMNMYFTNAFGRDWESVIQMKGWSHDYASWELAGNANNYDRNTLYFRTGRNSTWQAWREVAFKDQLSLANLGAQAAGFYCTAAERSGTVTDLYNQCRKTSGGVGSISLTASNGVPAGWYNYFYAPHRIGLESGDNHAFATILLCPMNFSGNCYIVRCSNYAIAEVRVLMTSTSPKWTAVTTTRGWASGTVNTYSNVLGNAIGVWIAGKPVAANTGLSALFIPIPLITTSETNFLINDEVQWVRVGMYRSGDNLYVVDRGRGKDGYVSHIYVLHSA